MYVTTFYSFKGGVGRTMALVNSAVTLALRRRRVLVVDFDVEAPGLDTFDVLRTREEVPGVIDFVTRYLGSGQAPDVAEYIGECPDIGDEGANSGSCRRAGPLSGGHYPRPRQSGSSG